MTGVHAWMPRSPCDTGCLPPEPPAVGAPSRWLRWTGLVLVALAAVALSLFAVPVPVVRPCVQRWTVRAVLRCCGVRLHVSGAPVWERDGRAVLVAAQHVSWLDALALPAVAPVVMVARADLAGWPVLGAVARRGRTVFLDRAALRELPGVVDQVAASLREGRCTAVFAEGTTWCGTAHGRFRPALLQAAVDTGAAVVPVAVRYTGGDGAPTTAAAFIGDETFVASLRRIVGLRGLGLEITVLPAQAPGLDRRELAARCTAAVELVGAEPPPLRVRVPEHQRGDGDTGVHSAQQFSARPPSTASWRRTITQSPQGSSARPSRPSSVAG